MTETSPTLSRAQLRSLCDHDAASPRSRLDAAAQLLQEYGASDRNLRIIRRTIRKFERFTADSPRTQQQVRWWAERLKGKLERILEASPVQPENPGDDDDIGLPEDEPFAAQPKRVLGNVDLLPSDDDDDEFWCELVGGHSRRELFLMSWSLDPSLSRGEIIDAISNDPAKIAAHTLTFQLWALSRDQADAKFARNSELVRAELTTRGLPDTEEGRQQLARQIKESGVPLVGLRPRDQESIYEVGPVLVRSAAGELLDSIEFTRTWPSIRTKHQPL